MSSHCHGCPARGRCNDCRARHRIAAQKSRARRGAISPTCFRCLGRHAPGEVNCPLAAEYDDAVGSNSQPRDTHPPSDDSGSDK